MNNISILGWFLCVPPLEKLSIFLMAFLSLEGERRRDVHVSMHNLAHYILIVFYIKNGLLVLLLYII